MFGPEFDSLRLHQSLQVPASQALIKNVTKKTNQLVTEPAVNITTPTLHDRGGDISKRWYIDYYIYDKSLSKPIRGFEYIPKGLDRDQRVLHAKKRISEIEESYKETPVIPGTLPPNILRIQNILTNTIDETILRDKSKSTYKTCVGHLCEFLKESKINEVSEISQDFASEFLNSMTLCYNPNTVKNTLNHLKATFSEAIRKKIIVSNPFVGIRLNISKEEGDFNTPFNDFEKIALEKHLKEHNFRLYLFTRFIFYAFFRPKELRHITVGDIDLRLKTIKVKGDVAKTGSRDVIPILKPLYQLIIENKMLNYPSSYYLFGKHLMPSPEKLPANLATSMHKDVLEELEIYKERITTLYAWKHTGNIHAYLAGMDIKMIQRINRHKSLATTEIYLKKLGLFLDKTVFDFTY